MSGFFGGNYAKSGPGIAKDGLKKNGLFDFLDIFFRKFWKLIALNVLYFICCIPIITIGPATAGFTKVLRNFSQERNAYLAHDFFDAFKKNFKQAGIMGLIDILFIVGFSIAIPAYNNMIGTSKAFMIPFAISLSTLVIFIMMNFYIYLMIVSTNLKLKQILKNSFILTNLGLKTNIITLIITLAVIIPLVLYFPFSGFIVPFLPLSFLGLVICYNSYPVLRKHVIQPFYDQQGEDNPEFNYLNPADDKDTLFQDKGGLEAPINIEKKPKGKTIS